MADTPLTAYEGDGPYFFVSYAHDDGASIGAEMRWISDAGFNLWYDDGIHVGSVWRQALADALSKAAGMVFFATAKSVESGNCLKELNFALDDEKPVFVVQFDETPLPTLLRLSLSDRQTLQRSSFDEAGYRARLSAALASVAPPETRSTPEANAAIATEMPSVAVQPLAGPAGDADLAFWAQGIIDDLQTFLSYRMFRIVSTASTDADPRAVGKALGVRYVVSGSVRPGGTDRRRVTMKLNDAVTGNQIWGERYDRQGDLLHMADEIATTTATDISSAIVDAEYERVAKLDESVLDAWELCVRAEHIRMHTIRDRDELIRLLELAVERDPGSASAQGWLAAWRAFSVMTVFSRQPDEDIAKAVQGADRALQLAPTEPVIMQVAAFVHRAFGDEQLALQLAQRATSIVGSQAMFGVRNLPNNLYGTLMQLGRADEAIGMALKDNPPPARSLSFAHSIIGDHEAAVEWARRATLDNPALYLTWVELANALAVNGQLDEARQAIDKVVGMVPTFKTSYYAKGIKLTWRHDHMVEPLVEGLLRLGLE